MDACTKIVKTFFWFTEGVNRLSNPSSQRTTIMVVPNTKPSTKENTLLFSSNKVTKFEKNKSLGFLSSLNFDKDRVTKT